MAKAPAIQAFLDSLTPFKRSPTVCPMCGKTPGEFKDELSQKEFEITGLCQGCQDEAFAPLPDDED